MIEVTADAKDRELLSALARGRALASTRSAGREGRMAFPGPDPGLAATHGPVWPQAQ